MMGPNDRTTAIAVFVSVFVFGPFLWMVLDRDPPFLVTNGRVHPRHPEVNSTITIEWDIKSTRTCQPSSGATVTRTIIDSKGVKHTYAPVHAVYGTPDQQTSGEIVRPVPLPEGISGPAKYSSVACYACNPIQEFWPICIQMPEVEFEIGSSPDHSRR